MTPHDFIAALAAPAQQSMATTKVPASFVIAEGALESGWGTSGLVVNAMNLFGVKADPAWTGDVYVLPTREYIGGQWVMESARWRKYSDWLSCINDHAQFLLSNERYAACFDCCGDALAFTRAVAAAGYATDPNYAAKITAIIVGNQLQQYDVLPAHVVPPPPEPVIVPSLPPDAPVSWPQTTPSLGVAPEPLSGQHPSTPPEDDAPAADSGVFDHH